MHRLPDDIQEILNPIIDCAKQNDAKLLLRGDLALYSITGNSDFLKEQKIDLVTTYDAGFETDELYQCLVQNIIISKEIEHSTHFYHMMSSEYEMKIDLIHQFDPTRLTQAQRFGNFNLDLLFLDVASGELRHPPEVSDDIKVLKNIHDESQWKFEDVLGFATWVGTVPELEIDKDQYYRLRLTSLGTLKESSDITWEEQIEEILLLRRSGAALKFISETFVDGMPWTFKILVDYMISLDAGINEDSNIETVFNDEKFDLVDSYNKFLLEEKGVKETADEIHHRLTTVLKLLFDSPNLSIPQSPINKIQAMAFGALGRCCLGTKVGDNIVFFGCGEDMEEEDCGGLPLKCSAGSTDCLQEHPSFAHIPDINWNSILVAHREWCPAQVCPDADNIHCLVEIVSSSSSSNFGLSSSSSRSSSSSSQSSSSSSMSSSSQSSSSSSSSSSQSSSSDAVICTICPSFDESISPAQNTPWREVSGFIEPGGCVMYKVVGNGLSPSYQAKLCKAPVGAPENAFSDFEGKLSVFTSAECPSSPGVETDARTCTTNTPNTATIQWDEGVESVWYLKVEEHPDGTGSGGYFTLAYLGIVS